MKIKELRENTEKDWNNNGENDDYNIIILKIVALDLIDNMQIKRIIRILNKQLIDFLLIDGDKDILSINNEINETINKTHNDGNISIEKHSHKELPIHETNTIIDPRTMMIHIKDTSLALGTMMSPFWFKYVAG